MILQSRLCKIYKNCIFLNHDYNYFTKILYLCTKFQKCRHENEIGCKVKNKFLNKQTL